MTTRSADEAQLSDDAGKPSPVRTKTTHDRSTLIIGTIQSQETEQQLDALAYTPTPTPNPLDIHGWSTDRALENLNSAQRAMWIADPGPKLLAYKAYGGRIEDKKEILQIRAAIKSALGLAGNPIVAIPVPEVKPGKKEGPPLCALIKNISQANADSLITRVRTYPTPPYFNN